MAIAKTKWVLMLKARSIVDLGKADLNAGSNGKNGAIQSSANGKGC